jgi:hypothetical protein
VKVWKTENGNVKERSSSAGAALGALSTWEASLLWKTIRRRENRQAVKKQDHKNVPMVVTRST